MTYVGSGDIIDIHRFPAREPNKRIFHKPQKMEEKNYLFTISTATCTQDGMRNIKKIVNIHYWKDADLLNKREKLVDILSLLGLNKKRCVLWTFSIFEWNVMRLVLFCRTTNHYIKYLKVLKKTYRNRK